MQQRNLAELPVDALYQIAKHLTKYNDLHAFVHTCTSMRNAAQRLLDNSSMTLLKHRCFVLIDVFVNERIARNDKRIDRYFLRFFELRFLPIDGFIKFWNQVKFKIEIANSYYDLFILISTLSGGIHDLSCDYYPDREQRDFCYVILSLVHEIISSDFRDEHLRKINELDFYAIQAQYQLPYKPFKLGDSDYYSVKHVLWYRVLNGDIDAALIIQRDFKNTFENFGLELKPSECAIVRAQSVLNGQKIEMAVDNCIPIKLQRSYPIIYLFYNYKMSWEAFNKHVLKSIERSESQVSARRNF